MGKINNRREKRKVNRKQKRSNLKEFFRNIPQEIKLYIFAGFEIISGAVLWAAGDPHWSLRWIVTILISTGILQIILFIIPKPSKTENGIKEDNPKEKRFIQTRKTISISLITISFIAIAVLVFYFFYFINPQNIEQTTKSTETQVALTHTSTAKSTITPTPLLTFTPTPTVTPTQTSIPTITPTYTITPTPTNTPIHKNINVGIFDLGEGCFKQEIYQKMQGLGFLVEIIPFDIEYQELLTYDVLYLSSGWACKQDKINEISVKLKGFLSYGKGILFGNPELIEDNLVLSYPDEPNEGLLQLPVHIVYEKLNKIEEYDSYNTCETSSPDCHTHWIIYDIDINEFPYPETIIKFPTNRQHWVLTLGNNSRDPSLVIGSGPNKFFVLLAGGEFSSPEKTIGDKLFTRIILWLANRIPEGDKEWYPYIEN